MNSYLKASLQRPRTIGRRLLWRAGLDVVRHIPADFDEDEQAIVRAVQGSTMTGPLRVQSLVQAVRYVVDAGIPGALVECGVWRGGSMMAAALALKSKHRLDRDLYLFDTFEGMTRPGEQDRDALGTAAAETFQDRSTGEDTADWCAATMDEVTDNLGGTGYPSERVHLVKGRVEDTVPAEAPERIALLRLDTDWYDSTRHEMEHLFPRLVPGGVLILDDYGHWQGSRQAVDEYLAEAGVNILLQRIDYTGRIAVKAR